MKLRVLIIISLLFQNIFAYTLNEIIDISLNENIYLKSIDDKLKANIYNIENSNNYENPELFMYGNTINSNEPMNNKSIGFKQKIDIWDKLSLNKNLNISLNKLDELKLKDSKIKLVYKIKSTAYSIWKVKEEIKIINKYLLLAEKSKLLFKRYSITSNKQMGIISTELTISNLKVKKIKKEKEKEKLFYLLNYLTNKRIDKLNINLIVEKELSKIYNEKIISNPLLSSFQEKIKYQNIVIEKKKLDYYPDLNINASYSYRENFDDYGTIGFSIKLPIYGTEKSKIEENKILLTMKSKEYNDFYLYLKSEKLKYNEEMKSSFDIYNILNNENTYSINQMFDLSIKKISTGESLFRYIDILKQKLDLEKQIINAIFDYNLSKAKIEKILGKIK